MGHERCHDKTIKISQHPVKKPNHSGKAHGIRGPYLYLPGDYEHPFNETAIEKPSRDWLKNLAGRMIAAGRPTMRKARIGVRRLEKRRSRASTKLTLTAGRK